MPRRHEVIPDRAGDAAAVDRIRATAARGPGSWTISIVLLVFVAWIVYALITNPGFQWDVVGQYLFASEVLSGLAVTAYVVALSMAIAIVLGIVLGVMRLSRNATAYLASSAYVWFFRGTPVLVQLIFWYNLASLYPKLKFGIPFGGPEFASTDSNRVMTPIVAAVLGLSLNEAAYYAEIVRGGILSVDAGQTVAAKALGFRPVQIMRRIVLPQAMRAIIPPTGNQVIAMLKYSALASVIAVPELLHSAQTIYNTNFQTIPLLIVASIWYLALVTALSIGQRYLERHFARGSVEQEPWLLADLRRRLGPLRRKSGS